MGSLNRCVVRPGLTTCGFFHTLPQFRKHWRDIGNRSRSQGGYRRESHYNKRGGRGWSGGTKSTIRCYDV